MSRKRKPPPLRLVLPTDALGEPLESVDATHLAAAHPSYAGKRLDGLLPGDLVDIYSLLGQGLNLVEISSLYGVSKKQMERFILKHKNAQITHCPPEWAKGYTPMNCIRPKPAPKR